MSVCSRMSRMLPDAMDRKLDDEQGDALRRHLDVCDGCRRFQAQLMTMRQGMRSLHMSSGDFSDPPKDGDVRPAGVSA
jgi:Putative zinc-finger